MRKRSIALGLASASLLIGGLAIATPAHADTEPDQICIAAVDKCMNNWQGEIEENNPVDYYSSGAIYNNFYMLDQGEVVGEECGGSGQPECWPFTKGTGLNARYNGDTVYEFDYQGGESEPTGYCLDAYNYATGTYRGKIYTCSSTDAYQLNVDSGEGFLVSVGASNLATTTNGEETPVWWGCSGGTDSCTDGAPTWISASITDSQIYYFQGGA